MSSLLFRLQFFTWLLCWKKTLISSLCTHKKSCLFFTLEKKKKKNRVKFRNFTLGAHPATHVRDVESCFRYFMCMVLFCFLNLHHLRGVWECGYCCFSKCFSLRKVPIIFFYFLKIIFEISTSKWFENIKNILLQSKKKKFKIF